MKPNEMTLEISVNGKKIIDCEESKIYERKELAFIVSLLLGADEKMSIKINIEK